MLFVFFTKWTIIFSNNCQTIMSILYTWILSTVSYIKIKIKKLNTPHNHHLTPKCIYIYIKNKKRFTYLPLLNSGRRGGGSGVVEKGPHIIIFLWLSCRLQLYLIDYIIRYKHPTIHTHPHKDMKLFCFILFHFCFECFFWKMYSWGVFFWGGGVVCGGLYSLLKFFSLFNVFSFLFLF